MATTRWYQMALISMVMADQQVTIEPRCSKNNKNKCQILRRAHRHQTGMAQEFQNPADPAVGKLRSRELFQARDDKANFISRLITSTS